MRRGSVQSDHGGKGRRILHDTLTPDPHLRKLPIQSGAIIAKARVAQPIGFPSSFAAAPWAGIEKQALP